ncbi:hypothetical protein BDM02DRAFT_3087501 [Thelephora ganbajun]|uniref:Uncharacterized protein n=1 Tax=Thelephora ganbajun TaxID=370292 RepID=A0ACB6ZVC5_THEGA|nr:hypothetical protein BDM02DRAFT_3087501 [Thelephora ganbajun]
MPKVVSRAAVSTSQDAQSTPSSAANFRVYYCICGEYILIIDKPLPTLPKRQTDGATIVQAKDTQEFPAKVFKLNATPMEPILYERQDGKYERQWRYTCPRCNLPVAYQTVPPASNPQPSTKQRQGSTTALTAIAIKSSTYFYIIKGALSQIQGQAPTDAFE